MYHEKIIKRENGDSVKIITSVYIDNFSSKNAVYDISVMIRGKGKKKWQDVHSTDDYKWRALSMDDRKKYQMGIYLQHVSQDEILKSKLELWELMKPE